MFLVLDTPHIKFGEMDGQIKLGVSFDVWSDPFEVVEIEVDVGLEADSSNTTVSILKILNKGVNFVRLLIVSHALMFKIIVEQLGIWISLFCRFEC